MSEQMQTGTIKWFDWTKGYGFIARSGKGEKDVFVHAKEVTKSGLDKNAIKEGSAVTFDFGTDPKTNRPCATNIKLNSNL